MLIKFISSVTIGLVIMVFCINFLVSQCIDIIENNGGLRQVTVDAGREIKSVINDIQKD